MKIPQLKKKSEIKRVTMSVGKITIAGFIRQTF